MQQVKIFKSLESDVKTLEKEVNEWIRQSGARIVSITGNIAPQSESPGSTARGIGQSCYPPSDLVLVVLYEVAAS